jgi:hypothetical protein
VNCNKCTVGATICLICPTDHIQILRLFYTCGIEGTKWTGDEMTGDEMTKGRNDRDEMTGEEMKGDES